MNPNDLLAAAGHHQRVPFGMAVLAILVLAALGFGAVRLSHRLRQNRRPRSVTKPEPPGPVPEPPGPVPEPPGPVPEPPTPVLEPPRSGRSSTSPASTRT